MEFDLALLLGLLSIAVAVFFGLRGFGTSVSSQLSAIRERVTAMSQTVEKVWDLLSNAVPQLLGQRGGTVERNLKNLGRTKIEARPGPTSTDYVIEVEIPVLRDNLIAKFGQESGFTKKVEQLLGQVAAVHGLSPSKVILHLPCTDARVCTEFMSLFLNWLDSTYFEQLERINDFEKPILRGSG